MWLCCWEKTGFDDECRQTTRQQKSEASKETPQVVRWRDENSFATMKTPKRKTEGSKSFQIPRHCCLLKRPPAEQKPYIHSHTYSHPRPSPSVCTSMWSVVNQLASSWPPRGRTWRSTSTAKFPHCNTKRKDSHRLLRGIELTDNKGNQSAGDWQRDKPQRPPVSSNITPGLSQQSPPSCFSV